MTHSPLFVLIGNGFLCEEKRREILSSLEKKWGPGLPVTLYRSDDLNLETLFAEASTLPFLIHAQVFCIRDADGFKKNDLELWAAYFKAPSAQTFFIFEAESLEKGHPFLNWAGAGQVFYLKAQTEKLASDFIQKKLRQAQKKITSRGLDYLEAQIGDSLIFLDSFVDQLILQAGDKSEIDQNDIEILGEKLVQFEGGDLIHALTQRNVTKSLEVLNQLMEVNARDFPALIGLLHWQFRRFWEAKKWMEEGASEQDVASRLKLWPARASIFFKELRFFSLAELEKLLEGLFILDWKLKSGRAEGRYEIETWLLTSSGS